MKYVLVVIRKSIVLIIPLAAPSVADKLGIKDKSVFIKDAFIFL